MKMEVDHTFKWGLLGEEDVHASIGLTWFDAYILVKLSPVLTKDWSVKNRTICPFSIFLGFPQIKFSPKELKKCCSSPFQKANGGHQIVLKAYIYVCVWMIQREKECECERRQQSLSWPTRILHMKTVRGPTILVSDKAIISCLKQVLQRFSFRRSKTWVLHSSITTLLIVILLPLT